MSKVAKIFVGLGVVCLLLMGGALLVGTITSINPEEPEGSEVLKATENSSSSNDLFDRYN